MANAPQAAIPPVVDVSTVINFLVAIVLPLAISYFQSWRATSAYKAIFSFGVCALVALLVTVLTKAYVGHWSSDPAENIRLVVLNILTVLLTAWNFYARLYHPTGLADKLEQAGPQAGDPKAGSRHPQPRSTKG